MRVCISVGAHHQVGIGKCTKCLFCEACLRSRQEGAGFRWFPVTAYPLMNLRSPQNRINLHSLAETINNVYRECFTIFFKAVSIILCMHTCHFFSVTVELNIVKKLPQSPPCTAPREEVTIHQKPSWFANLQVNCNRLSARKVFRAIHKWQKLECT